jgi:hypothetical protein
MTDEQEVTVNLSDEGFERPAISEGLGYWRHEDAAFEDGSCGRSSMNLAEKR